APMIRARPRRNWPPPPGVPPGPLPPSLMAPPCPCSPMVEMSTMLRNANAGLADGRGCRGVGDSLDRLTRLPQVAFGQGLEPVVAALDGLGEDQADLGHEAGIAPGVAGRLLGAGGVAEVGAGEQRPRGGHLVPGIVPGRERVARGRAVAVF